MTQDEKLSALNEGEGKTVAMPEQGRGLNFLAMFKDFGPTAYAVAAAALYISGFLVHNSNLAQSGILDVEFIDARYLLAGASFTFYLVCFYLFAGRAVLFMKRWLGEDLYQVNKQNPAPVWSFVVFVHANVTALFFLCLSAALFTSFAIGSFETSGFYLALFSAFLVLYTFYVANWDVQFPRISAMITLVAKSIAIFVFFAYGKADVMHSIFYSYLTIFFFINLVLDVFNRYKVTNDRITFSGLYAIVVLFGSAIGFGSMFYGKVSPKLGGARPQAVTVGFSDDVRKTLSPKLLGSVGQFLDGKLVHQTPSYTYIVVSDRTIRFRAADVVTLVSTPEPDKSTLAALPVVGNATATTASQPQAASKDIQLTKAASTP